MSETTSFFAGCATAGLAVFFLVGGGLPDLRSGQSSASGVSSSQALDNFSQSGSGSSSNLVSERDWNNFLDAIEDQQAVSDELYGRLEDQQAITDRLEEQLEEQTDGLKERQSDSEEIVDLFEEQQSYTEQIVGLFEEQQSDTEQIVALFEEQQSDTAQIAALVEEQQSIIESMNESVSERQGQLTTASRNSGFSMPLFLAISAAFIVITVLVGIIILLIIAFLIQSRNRAARTIHREYHVPPAWSLPAQSDWEAPYPPQQINQGGTYRPVTRYPRRIDAVGNVAEPPVRNR